MELRQLRYFVSAAKHLNFTRAAAECCVVQSAMSQQITSLEKELGTTLFERTNRGLCLTPEGEAMEREALRLLEQAERVRGAVKHARDGYRERLRIGRCDGLLYEALPKALSQFHADCPNTLVQLSEVKRSTQLAELDDGGIDCLITLWEPMFEALDWVNVKIIGDDPVCVALPEKHPLAGKPSLTISQLSGETVLYGCEKAGEEGKALCASREDAEALVRAGYGIAVCLKSAARPCEGIVYKEISDKAPGRVCVLWRRESPMENHLENLSSLLVMLPTE